MNLDQFVTQRRPSWQQLEALTTHAHRRASSLSLQDLDELGRLYRSATADLALAQRDFPKQDATIYLNQLVARAHNFIYRSPPLRWQGVKRFYTEIYPRLYRTLLPYTILAAAIFFLGAVAAFLVVWNDPEAIYIIAGPQIAPLVKQVEEGRLWIDIAPTARSAAAGMIFTNNIQVMFMTFAGGVTAGILSAWVLLNNGMGLGAIFGLLQAHALVGGLAEFVAAHGFIELSIIFLAGGCGLFLGDGLIRPGLHSRRETLVERGQVSVRLILGSAPLLVFAGLIEGFISPSSLHWSLKVGVGLLTGIALYWYWLRAGRTGREQIGMTETISLRIRRRIWGSHDTR